MPSLYHSFLPKHHFLTLYEDVSVELRRNDRITPHSENLRSLVFPVLLSAISRASEYKYCCTASSVIEPSVLVPPPNMSGPILSTKLAACDPCRFSKLACDHVRPVCGRCRSKGLAATCEYRIRPFKKRRTIPALPTPHRVPRSEDTNRRPPSIAQALTTPSIHQYPNPGYLGNSSHTTIFQNLTPAVENANYYSTPGSDDDQFLQGVKLIKDIQGQHLEQLVALVEHWTKQSGVNLPLAADFVMACAWSTESLSRLYDEGQATMPIHEFTHKVFRNSCKPVATDQNSTINDFVANFNATNIRWETIGLFLTAVSRASIDVPDFALLFNLAQQADSLKQLALRYADRCLEISLSLDRLNDLQLILQYENFINHSFVDGDQSYHSWKRLGDVISSIFALGYHEKIDPHGRCPEFLVHLRESVVARTYSADKNVSVFLGRPPRMIRKFCCFDFLDVALIQNNGDTPDIPYYLGWTPNKAFDYTLDTWWSFVCALLKEEILDLSVEGHPEKKLERASATKERAQERWKTLPSKYRYSGDLKLYQHKPIERDFIASARLNYLHTLLMLRQVFTKNATEPDTELSSICAEILNLTAKIVIMKNRLTNSGTGLIWKICHYGLPAAGILCLSLLRSLPSRPQILQDLSVIVAHVDSGILIDHSDPDYALLAAAARAIQTILDKVLTHKTARAFPVQEQSAVAAIDADSANEEWLPWSGSETWDFEMDFWTTLVEHPVLDTSGLTNWPH